MMRINTAGTGLSILLVFLGVRAVGEIPEAGSVEHSIAISGVLGAEEVFILPEPDSTAPIPWDMNELATAPQTFPAPDFESGAGLRITPLFFQGEPIEGKETRVFAWIGIPDGTGPFPGMVLVHGGGGTAYKEWVQLWVNRGYAAIAMDTAGQIPKRAADRSWLRHEYSGPAGWGDFTSVDKPPFEQWPYHAVAAVIRAHSLLRSYKQVDASRIGITGISWGGFLTCIAAGLDDRLSLAAPVYGCGFLGENSSWLSAWLRPMGREKAVRWLSLWDPSRYVNRSRIPLLFVNGTNDRHYRPDSWQKTYRLVPGDVTLACRVCMVHSDLAGRAPEVPVYADSVFKEGDPLPKITGWGRKDRHAWITYESTVSIQKAELNFTTDTGEWQNRRWQSVEVPVDTENAWVETDIPAEATAYYINLFDSRGLVVSAEHEEL